MKNTRKRTDFIANKTMAVFGLAIIGILCLVGISHAASTSAGYVAVLNLSWVAVGVGAAGLIAAIIWMIRDSRRETPDMRYFSGVDLAVISLLILVSGLLFRIFDVLSVSRLLYILFPACAVLYLVFMLLPRIFFLQTLLCGGALICMWVVSLSNSGAGRLFAILGIVLAVIFGVFFLLLRSGDGTIGGRLRLLPSGEAYLPAFLTVLVTIVLFVIAAILASAAAGSVLLYILCGYLFVLTVYYIVKLM